MGRRLLIFAGSFLTLVITAVLAMPWWWGPTLRAFAEKRGVEMGLYSTVGYGRWSVEDVVVRRARWELALNRVEAPHPLAWWWRRSATGPVDVDGWSFRWIGDVAVEGSPAEPTGDAESVDWLTVRQGLREWGPEIILQSGRVEVAGMPVRATIDRLRLTAGHLELSRVQASPVEFGGHITWNDASLLVLSFEDEARSWAFQLRATESADELAITGSWWENELSGILGVDPESWRPERINLRSESWTVDGGALGWGDRLATLSGDSDFVWSPEGFNLSVIAGGVPLAGSRFPEARVTLVAMGDTREARVQRLDVSLPGLSASLDEPLVISREAGGAETPSQFRIEADLSELISAEIEGQLRGALTTTYRAESWPEMRGAFDLANIGFRDLPRLAGRFAGELTWPGFRIEQLELQSDDGLLLAGSAIGNAATGRIESANATASLASSVLRMWLPSDVDFDQLDVSASVNGEWTELEHTGHFELTNLRVPKLKPLAAEGDWRGGRQRAVFDVRTRSEASELELQAVLDPEQIELSNVELRCEETVVWTVARARIAQVGESWFLDETELTGPGLSLATSGLDARNGNLHWELQETDLNWVGDWWAEPVPPMGIGRLSGAARWTPTDLAAEARVLMEFDLDQVGSINVAADVAGDAHGLAVSEFWIGRGGVAFASARGEFPVALSRSESGAFQWKLDEEETLRADVSVSPHPEFWQPLGAATGITLVRPEVELALTGTWAQPVGAGLIAIERLSLPATEGFWHWPTLENLRATLAGDSEGVALEDMTVTVESQRLRARGRLPVTLQSWRELQESPLRYLRTHGEAAVELPDADMAAVARFVPDYLAPVGRVALAVEFSPGGDMAGALSLRDAASRPLGPLGVMQEITADVTFAGRQVFLDQLSATVGGQPVTLTGSAELPVGGQPLWDARLTGDNLPLVRRTGLLLRGDLDLRLRTDEAGNGELSGGVHLADGVMVADIRSLIPEPSGGQRPATRPPYFSVGVEPLRDWAVDIAVSGNRFLRMQTPVVDGVASVEARLQGTLGVPRAVGEVRIEEAEVKLPFARFDVENGRIELTEENPFAPELSIAGEGKRLGYDLRMELTGTVDRPRLHFSSTPVLPAADVILLVMAGVVPREDFAYTGSRRAVQVGTFLGQGIFNGLWRGSDRLTVTSGESLSRQGRETYRFSYEVDERWSLVGEYDEFDHYNAAVKWRLMPNSARKAEEASP